MRWSSAHVGNIRQAPLEGQEVVNDEMKVPEPPGADAAPDEEAEPKRGARVAEARAERQPERESRSGERERAEPATSGHQPAASSGPSSHERDKPKS